MSTRETDGTEGGADEPDPRWSLANERTLLAYTRTALSLLVAGLAIAASPAVTETPRWLAVLGLPLIGLAAAVSLAARTRYVRSERAMRLGEPLGKPPVAAMLPWSIALIASIGIVLAAIALATS